MLSPIAWCGFPDGFVYREDTPAGGQRDSHRLPAGNSDWGAVRNNCGLADMTFPVSSDSHTSYGHDVSRSYVSY